MRPFLMTESLLISQGPSGHLCLLFIPVFTEVPRLPSVRLLRNWHIDAPPSCGGRSWINRQPGLHPGSLWNSLSRIKMGSFSLVALLFPLLLQVMSGSLNTTGITMLDSNGTTPDFNNTETLPLVTPVMHDSNETTPVYNGTEPLNTTTWTPPSIPVPLEYSRSCRQDPPTCCMSFDSSCYRGCFCDVGCLRRGNCCPDFKETCVTGFQNETTDLPTNGTNITSSGDFNASSPFPIWSLSGSCKSPQPMCCSWSDDSCYRGCFCDKGCMNYGDCCPDYYSTCTVTTLLNLNVRLRVPITASESEIQSALYTGAGQLEQALQNRYGYYWYWWYNNYSLFGVRVTRIARKP